MQANFSFGIEEEYFLVDAQTKFVARAMPDGFIKKAKDALNGKVTGEFLQSQIEVVTPPLTDIAQRRARIARSAQDPWPRSRPNSHMAIFAAGTHPTAVWERSQQSEGERYDNVMDDLQMIGRRNMLCGLHVHVELPDPDAARRCDDADAAVRAAVHCIVDLFAVLAFAAHRVEGLSPGGL